MLYLSRLILDIRSRAVRRDLGNCYQLHRTLLAAFPQVPAGAQAREQFGLLYRAEPIDSAPGLIRLLLQSNAVPTWAHLPAGYLGPDLDGRGNPALRAVDDEYAQVHAGMRLIFRLRANPTRRISQRNTTQDERWRGKRIELRREEDLRDWLERKGQQHGFRPLATAVQPELPDVQARVQEQARGRRPASDDRPAMPLHFGAVLFTGQLDVADSQTFRSALTSGIGSGKAFGFGLLSIASPR